MRCESCSAQMQGGQESYGHTECGLDTVTLVDVEVRRCAECGEHEVSVPRIEELHRLIAQQVALKKARLTPQEIRFLRKYLDFSEGAFVGALDATPETASWWEMGKEQVGPVAERVLRLMVLIRSPVEEYPLEWLAQMTSIEAVPLSVKFQVLRPHWKVE